MKFEKLSIDNCLSKGLTIEGFLEVPPFQTKLDIMSHNLYKPISDSISFMSDFSDPYSIGSPFPSFSFSTDGGDEFDSFQETIASKIARSTAWFIDEFHSERLFSILVQARAKEDLKACLGLFLISRSIFYHCTSPLLSLYTSNRTFARYVLQSFEFISLSSFPSSWPRYYSRMRKIRSIATELSKYGVFGRLPDCHYHSSRRISKRSDLYGTFVPKFDQYSLSTPSKSYKKSKYSQSIVRSDRLYPSKFSDTLSPIPPSKIPYYSSLQGCAPGCTCESFSSPHPSLLLLSSLSSLLFLYHEVLSMRSDLCLSTRAEEEIQAHVDKVRSESCTCESFSSPPPSLLLLSSLSSLLFLYHEVLSMRSDLCLSTRAEEEIQAHVDKVRSESFKELPWEHVGKILFRLCINCSSLAEKYSTNRANSTQKYKSSPSSFVQSNDNNYNNAIDSDFVGSSKYRTRNPVTSKSLSKYRMSNSVSISSVPDHPDHQSRPQDAVSSANFSSLDHQAAGRKRRMSESHSAFSHKIHHAPISPSSSDSRYIIHDSEEGEEEEEEEKERVGRTMDLVQGRRTDGEGAGEGGGSGGEEEDEEEEDSLGREIGVKRQAFDSLEMMADEQKKESIIIAAGEQHQSPSLRSTVSQESAHHSSISKREEFSSNQPTSDDGVCTINRPIQIQTVESLSLFSFKNFLKTFSNPIFNHNHQGATVQSYDVELQDGARHELSIFGMSAGDKSISNPIVMSELKSTAHDLDPNGIESISGNISSSQHRIFSPSPSSLSSANTSIVNSEAERYRFEPREAKEPVVFDSSRSFISPHKASMSSLKSCSSLSLFSNSKINYGLSSLLPLLRMLIYGSGGREGMDKKGSSETTDTFGDNKLGSSTNNNNTNISTDAGGTSRKGNIIRDPLQPSQASQPFDTHFTDDKAVNLHVTSKEHLTHQGEGKGFSSSNVSSFSGNFEGYLCRIPDEKEELERIAKREYSIDDDGDRIKQANDQTPHHHHASASSYSPISVSMTMVPSSSHHISQANQGRTIIQGTGMTTVGASSSSTNRTSSTSSSHGASKNRYLDLKREEEDMTFESESDLSESTIQVIPSGEKQSFYVRDRGNDMIGISQMESIMDINRTTDVSHPSVTEKVQLTRLKKEQKLSSSSTNRTSSTSSSHGASKNRYLDLKREEEDMTFESESDLSESTIQVIPSGEKQSFYVRDRGNDMIGISQMESIMDINRTTDVSHPSVTEKVQLTRLKKEQKRIKKEIEKRKGKGLTLSSARKTHTFSSIASQTSSSSSSPSSSQQKQPPDSHSQDYQSIPHIRFMRDNNKKPSPISDISQALKPPIMDGMISDIPTSTSIAHHPTIHSNTTSPSSSSPSSSSPKIVLPQYSISVCEACIFLCIYGKGDKERESGREMLLEVWERERSSIDVVCKNVQRRSWWRWIQKEIEKETSISQSRQQNNLCYARSSEPHKQRESTRRVGLKSSVSSHSSYKNRNGELLSHAKTTTVGIVSSPEGIDHSCEKTEESQMNEVSQKGGLRIPQDEPPHVHEESTSSSQLPNESRRKLKDQRDHHPPYLGHNNNSNNSNTGNQNIFPFWQVSMQDEVSQWLSKNLGEYKKECSQLESLRNTIEEEAEEEERERQTFDDVLRKEETTTESLTTQGASQEADKLGYLSPQALIGEDDLGASSLAMDPQEGVSLSPRLSLMFADIHTQDMTGSLPFDGPNNGEKEETTDLDIEKEESETVSGPGISSSTKQTRRNTIYSKRRALQSNIIQDGDQLDKYVQDIVSKCVPPLPSSSSPPPLLPPFSLLSSSSLSSALASGIFGLCIWCIIREIERDSYVRRINQLWTEWHHSHKKQVISTIIKQHLQNNGNNPQFLKYFINRLTSFNHGKQSNDHLDDYTLFREKPSQDNPHQHGEEDSASYRSPLKLSHLSTKPSGTTQQTTSSACSPSCSYIPPLPSPSSSALASGIFGLCIWCIIREIERDSYVRRINQLWTEWHHSHKKQVISTIIKQHLQNNGNNPQFLKYFREIERDSYVRRINQLWTEWHHSHKKQVISTIIKQHLQNNGNNPQFLKYFINRLTSFNHGKQSNDHLDDYTLFREKPSQDNPHQHGEEDSASYRSPLKLSHLSTKPSGTTQQWTEWHHSHKKQVISINGNNPQFLKYFINRLTSFNHGKQSNDHLDDYTLFREKPSQDNPHQHGEEDSASYRSPLKLSHLSTKPSGTTQQTTSSACSPSCSYIPPLPSPSLDDVSRVVSIMFRDACKTMKMSDSDLSLLEIQHSEISTVSKDLKQVHPPAISQILAILFEHLLVIRESIEEQCHGNESLTNEGIERDHQQVSASTDDIMSHCQSKNRSSPMQSSSLKIEKGCDSSKSSLSSSSSSSILKSLESRPIVNIPDSVCSLAWCSFCVIRSLQEEKNNEDVLRAAELEIRRKEEEKLAKEHRKLQRDRRRREKTISGIESSDSETKKEEECIPEGMLLSPSEHESDSQSIGCIISSPNPSPSSLHTENTPSLAANKYIIPSIIPPIFNRGFLLSLPAFFQIPHTSICQVLLSICMNVLENEFKRREKELKQIKISLKNELKKQRRKDKEMARKLRRKSGIETISATTDLHGDMSTTRLTSSSQNRTTEKDTSDSKRQQQHSPLHRSPTSEEAGIGVDTFFQIPHTSICQVLLSICMNVLENEFKRREKELKQIKISLKNELKKQRRKDKEMARKLRRKSGIETISATTDLHGDMSTTRLTSSSQNRTTEKDTSDSKRQQQHSPLHRSPTSEEAGIGVDSRYSSPIPSISEQSEDSVNANTQGIRGGKRPLNSSKRNPRDEEDKEEEDDGETEGILIDPSLLFIERKRKAEIRQCERLSDVLLHVLLPILHVLTGMYCDTSLNDQNKKNPQPIKTSLISDQHLMQRQGFVGAKDGSLFHQQQKVSPVVPTRFPLHLSLLKHALSVVCEHVLCSYGVRLNAVWRIEGYLHTGEGVRKVAQTKTGLPSLENSGIIESTKGDEDEESKIPIIPHSAGIHDHKKIQGNVDQSSHIMGSTHVKEQLPRALISLLQRLEPAILKHLSFLSPQIPTLAALLTLIDIACGQGKRVRKVKRDSSWDEMIKKSQLLHMKAITSSSTKPKISASDTGPKNPQNGPIWGWSSHSNVQYYDSMGSGGIEYGEARRFRGERLGGLRTQKRKKRNTFL
ncbi:hypothetical protein ADUPG1_012723 [Aduncisulcus paluster]|uniref:Uncharacterized protein n=1 Tax=Aduncisulcus paluster TaxID=2918883 RepID=A0ABQ5K2A2_9EUKA|nr:hypothetical protein ADUPG1_012723 [Aduncisulcus paluster]